jgi:hypothetical protein
VADSFLLVPGTGGVTLLENGVTDIGYPFGLYINSFFSGNLSQSQQDLLSMEHIPDQIDPKKTTLKRNSFIKPGSVINSAYNQVIPSVIPYPYDWRADIRYNAEKLLDFLITRKPAGGKWRLMTHSQGGLVLVIASKLYSASSGGDLEAFSSLVSRIVFVGVPFYGTIQAIRGFIDGDYLGDGARRRLQLAIRTWPSIYQQLPDWKNSIEENGVRGNLAEEIFNPAKWTGINNIQDELLKRAKFTRVSYLRNPFRCMDNIKYNLIFAKNRDTFEYVVRDNTGLNLPLNFVPGDNLVPVKITCDLLVRDDPSVGNKITILKGSNIREHPMLFDDAEVVPRVKRFLGL